MESQGLDLQPASPPPPGTGSPVFPGAREVHTASWRTWIWPIAAPADSFLVYITSEPEYLDEVVAQVLPLGARQVALVRVARTPQVVALLNSVPQWTGKAVTFLLTGRQEARDLAEEADSLLAGGRVSGPPALLARPLGGRSGMVFLRSVASAAQRSPADSRRDRLAALLGP